MYSNDAGVDKTRLPDDMEVERELTADEEEDALLESSENTTQPCGSAGGKRRLKT